MTALLKYMPGFHLEENELNVNIFAYSYLYLAFSSIGMAKAALEAINGCNLFGEKGSSVSVIYVDIDAHNRNRSIFETLLPRESSSKVRYLKRLISIQLVNFSVIYRTQMRPYCQPSLGHVSQPMMMSFITGQNLKLFVGLEATSVSNAFFGTATEQLWKI